MNLAVNVAAPLETASDKERFAYYRRLATRVMREVEFDGDTTDDTGTEIWTYEVPEDTMVYALASVTGVTASAAKVFSATRQVTFRRVGSAVVDVLAANIIGADFATDGGWDMGLSIGDVAGTIAIEVDGDAGDTVHWFGSVRLWVNKL